MFHFSKVSRPGLGGWLTMLNCAAILLLIAADRIAGRREWSDWDWYGHLLGFVLTMPFACFLLVPSVGGDPPVFSLIICSAVIGLNSFAWGYGMAAVMSRARRAICRVR